MNDARLELRKIVAGYGAMTVINELSICVYAGEKLSVFGHNGAGKSTLLKAVFGTLSTRSGDVLYADEDVTDLAVSDRLQRGISFVPQDGGVFRPLSVRENLRLAVLRMPNVKFTQAIVDDAVDLFPDLAQRLDQAVGSMSGGQRKMVSLSMSLVRRPRLLLLDEPSVGLAPTGVASVYSRLVEIQRELGCTVVIAEQNIRAALTWTERSLILRSGKVAWDGPSAELRSMDLVDIARIL